MILLTGAVAAAPIFKRIGGQGIKIVFIDNVPVDMAPGKDYVSVIASDNEANGYFAAKAMAEKIFSRLKPERRFGEIASVETETFRGDIDATLEALNRVFEKLLPVCATHDVPFALENASRNDPRAEATSLGDCADDFNFLLDEETGFGLHLGSFFNVRVPGPIGPVLMTRLEYRYVGDGYALAFKVESHNHPSAVEPYQGAATGVGGILRDIFTMGARPIAVLDSLRRLKARPVLRFVACLREELLIVVEQTPALTRANAWRLGRRGRLSQVILPLALPSRRVADYTEYRACLPSWSWWRRWLSAWR